MSTNRRSRCSVAEGDRRGEVRHFGVIASDLEPLDKVVRALRESQSMAPFEHTEQAFAPDTPSLAASEPAWTFIRAPRGRLEAAPRQDHWRTPRSVAACSLVAELKPDRPDDLNHGLILEQRVDLAQPAPSPE